MPAPQMKKAEKTFEQVAKEVLQERRLARSSLGRLLLQNKEKMFVGGLRVAPSVREVKSG